MRFLMQRGEPWAVVASRFAACGEILMFRDSAIRSAIVFNSGWLYGSNSMRVRRFRRACLMAPATHCQDQRELGDALKGGPVDSPLGKLGDLP